MYLVTGPADDGGEDGPGGVISREPGLAHAGPIVHNQSCYLVVTHGEGVVISAELKEAFT